MWQDYLQKNGTLKNKLDIKNQDELDLVEKRIVSENEIDLPNVPLNFNGLKKIHHHLFKDIYPWAGKIRTVNMKKDFGTPPFIDKDEINKTAKSIFNQLKQDNNLKDLSQHEFIKKATNLFGEINRLHPFREGNGRTQRLFLEQVAKQAGYNLDFSYTTKERMIQASIEFSEGNPEKMERIFAEIIDSKKINALRGFNDMLIQHRGIANWNDLYISHATEGQIYSGKFIGRDNISFTIQLNNNDIIISDYKQLSQLENLPNIGENIKIAILTDQQLIDIKVNLRNEI